MRLGCCGNMISPAADPIGIGIVESLAEMGFDYIELSLAGLAVLPDAIVMAQVSMTALEPRLTNTKVPVHNSGRTAFNRVRQILESIG